MKNKKLIIIILLTFIIILNSILVSCTNSLYIDKLIRNIIFSINSEVMTKIMRAITFFGSTPWIVGLCALVLILFIIFKQKEKGITTTIVLITSTLINNIIKPIIQRQRPIYMIVNENTFSFPSGHAMGSTTLYGFLIYLLLTSKLRKDEKIWGTSILLLTIILIGISRIYLGAHFFTDVFTGQLLSTLIILTFALINEKKRWI